MFKEIQSKEIISVGGYIIQFMKHYKFNKKILFNYKDYHPKKGYINWWEYEIDNTISKSSIRFKAKLNILRMIDEDYFNDDNDVYDDDYNNYD